MPTHPITTSLFKKFVAAGFFKHTRSNSAETLESVQSADDWVWNALDIARHAAMADDLAHIPSIREIADIFTRILEWLQTMKNSRGEFYLITNEIGSLIESIVRYGREHETTSERYKRICNDSLSTISSMQSETQRIVDNSVPPKRLTKEKSYKDVLSSFQFRVRRIHSDLQALTRSSSLISPKSTGMLCNSREIAILGGTFTEVHGNHYVFPSSGTADIQPSVDPTGADQTPAGPVDDFDFSDYEVLKYGELQAISVPQGRNGTPLLGSGIGQDAIQEYTVRIHDRIMTARTYRGQRALKIFKADVKLILEHNFRHPHIVQFFGVCPSIKVPTLVFHGDLKRLAFDQRLPPRELWCQRLQMFGECQAAFRYLMQQYRLRDSACDFLTQEGQFVDIDSGELYCIPLEAHFGSCSCYLYVDSCRRLQVSIESPTKKRGRVPFHSYFAFPKLSSPVVTAIKDALLSGGAICDNYQVDKEASLLAIHDFMIKVSELRSPRQRQSPVILISPMKRAKAARLTFSHKYRLQWAGWNTTLHGPGVETSYLTVKNKFWTRFTIPYKAASMRHEKHPNICCYSRFDAPSLYLDTWLAQADRIVSQVKLSCPNREHVMLLVTSVNCDIFFQSCFSPSSLVEVPEEVFLFVQDLQDVDEVFKIPWFWARDPKGLERLTPAEMHAFGLRELRQSKILVRTREAMPALWEELHIFHEVFGFAADSLDVPRFLDVPIASVEWDGDECGPLTPWESLTMDANEYRTERDRLLHM